MAIESNKEKKLIIARYFIKEKEKGNKFDEQDIFNMWNNYFSSDFRISKTGKLKIVNHGTYYKLEPKEDWPDIKKKDIKAASNTKYLAQYLLFDNGFQKSGYFTKLMEYVTVLQKEHENTKIQ